MAVRKLEGRCRTGSDWNFRGTDASDSSQDAYEEYSSDARINMTGSYRSDSYRGMYYDMRNNIELLMNLVFEPYRILFRRKETHCRTIISGIAEKE